MDRALDLGVLATALGGVGGLPTPDQLRTMLAEAEVAAFFRSGHEVNEDLVEAAWHLHQVGTVRPQLNLYAAERQVQANAVAAHILDLALQNSIEDPGEQLVTSFAAQVSSIRGDRTPNATAIGGRLPRPTAQIELQPGRASLELGCAFLTLDRPRVLSVLRDLEPQVSTLDQTIELELLETGIASAVGVVRGIRLLLRYLTDGDSDLLAEARSTFARAANNPASTADLDSRWVAAHLIDLCDDLGTSSVWAILPDGTPPAVGKAMTLGNPPVMTLWPPQVELLTDATLSPMQPAIRRSVLTFPTSAGKTLLAQLLIAHHLAVVGTGVCFVAPSHSLCREVRAGLDGRLWAIRRFIETDGPVGDPNHAHGHVVVMTPEKLAARLRADEAALLNEFGLFIFDEAHLVDDDTRGWTFEATVSRLHSLTLESDHRLILLSAALGGTASVQSWLGTGTPTTAATRTWRGPRRLHAVYSTDERNPRVVPPTGRQKKPRTVSDLIGVVNLYVDQGAAIASRGHKLGEVERLPKSVNKPTWSAQLLPIVQLAAQSGAVLTVHATKRAAEALAAEIAAIREDRAAALPLVRLVEQRMGPTNLVRALRRGVAYHHAALPSDVQAEIEGGVRQGILDIVCATTTLTEGVNLPVRTVIICERGYYDGSEFNALIAEAGLMNAAGRAGRAGRETEGWVVIAEQKGAPSARAAVRALETPQDIRSTLNTEAALAELSAYEALVHETGALTLEDVPPSVDGFMAYCWYLASVHDALTATEKVEGVLDGIRRTLAWQQLPDAIRVRWEGVARRVTATYEVTEQKRRRRWARSGARLSANLVLETVAKQGAAAVATLDADALNDPIIVLSALLAEGRLASILGLTNPRDYRFKVRRTGPVEEATVDLHALVLDWVRGAPRDELTRTHLQQVTDTDGEAFRFEQLSTFLTRICEHHLPFTLGTILEWVGEELGFPLNPDLPAHVHYGVRDIQAIELLKRGVRSRRLAVAVGSWADAADVGIDELRSWIANLGLATWRTGLEAGPAEVADLLQFVHDPSAEISAALLDGESKEILVDPAEGSFPANTDATVRWATGDDELPRPLLVVDSNGDPVAKIRASEYRHLQVLVDAGFRLIATPTAWDDSGRVLAVNVRARVD